KSTEPLAADCALTACCAYGEAVTGWRGESVAEPTVISSQRALPSNGFVPNAGGEPSFSGAVNRPLAIDTVTLCGVPIRSASSVLVACCHSENVMLVGPFIGNPFCLSDPWYVNAGPSGAARTGAAARIDSINVKANEVLEVINVPFVIGER